MQWIVDNLIAAINPEKKVMAALENENQPMHILAIGKAAWAMANAAYKALGDKALGGIVITKYQHSKGPIGNLTIYEAGHPIPDENSIEATEAAIQYFTGLPPSSHILFLISGGGSALFESLEEGISLQDMASISHQLLASGADITQMNTVRKRLSKVKGGKFARLCSQSKVHAVILSDVLGDDPSVIASGPVSGDSSTTGEAMDIVARLNINLPQAAMKWLAHETPKDAPNTDIRIIGSVHALCEAAAQMVSERGYEPYVLAENISCEARCAGGMVASIAVNALETDVFKKPCALIFGGETVVKVTGGGKGGRNQELALSAAMGIENRENICILSFGSDGTDGPTDAAGGIVDGGSMNKYRTLGIRPVDILDNNDAYSLLQKSGDLLVTGPTGTNMNDVVVVLIR